MSVRARIGQIIVKKNRQRQERARDRYGLWLWGLHRENRRKDKKTLRLLAKLRSQEGHSLTSCASIAAALNEHGSRNRCGGLWSCQTVRTLLIRAKGVVW